MATNVTSAPSEKVQSSPKLATAISAYQKAIVGAEIALDTLRNTAKSETVRLALADKKALTAVLFASGLSDARTVSELVGFVFPASDSAKAELEKVMTTNAKQTDPKKRIAKPIIMALQRDKTGKLTLEKAIAAHKLERTPGGKTDPTTKAKTKKTAKEIEEELASLFAAALAFGKEQGYDEDDCTQVFEDQRTEAFPADDAEDDKDETED